MAIPTPYCQHWFFAALLFDPFIPATRISAPPTRRFVTKGQKQCASLLTCSLSFMPLLDIHSYLVNHPLKHLNCPFCGSDMELKKEKQKMGLWCRLVLRTPNIKQYYHCATCGHNYGLVELGGK